MGRVGRAGRLGAEAKTTSSGSYCVVDPLQSPTNDAPFYETYQDGPFGDGLIPYRFVIRRLISIPPPRRAPPGSAPLRPGRTPKEMG